jgi:hypothetical protein
MNHQQQQNQQQPPRSRSPQQRIDDEINAILRDSTSLWPPLPVADSLLSLADASMTVSPIRSGMHQMHQQSEPHQSPNASGILVTPATPTVDSLTSPQSSVSTSYESVKSSHASAMDEKKLRRLEKNREAAKECRMRKKEYVSDLERRVHDLARENAQLKQLVSQLQQQPPQVPDVTDERPMKRARVGVTDDTALAMNEYVHLSTSSD